MALAPFVRSLPLCMLRKPFRMGVCLRIRLTRCAHRLLKPCGVMTLHYCQMIHYIYIYIHFLSVLAPRMMFRLRLAVVQPSLHENPSKTKLDENPSEQASCPPLLTFHLQLMFQMNAHFCKALERCLVPPGHSPWSTTFWANLLLMPMAIFPH